MNFHVQSMRIPAVLLIAALTGAPHFIPRIGNVHASNKQRIVDRSTALYEQITFARQTANVTSEETITYAHDGNPVPHLTVAITRETEKSGIIMDWNLRTTELIGICCEVHVPQGEGLQVMGKEEAKNVAASWLSILGFASQSPRWKLTSGPEHNPTNSYTVRWTGSGRDVTIRIQDQTGELLDAYVGRPD